MQTILQNYPCYRFTAHLFRWLGVQINGDQSYFWFVLFTIANNLFFVLRLMENALDRENVRYLKKTSPVKYVSRNMLQDRDAQSSIQIMTGILNSLNSMQMRVTCACLAEIRAKFV